MENTLFAKMTSLPYLFECWYKFKRGKRKRKDVQYFERFLEDHIFQLQKELSSLEYQHQRYHFFDVFDPKQRHIGKACVRDRLVHQVIYATLYPIFDRQFIFHSFSSRLGKGTHQGIHYLQRMIQKVSANGSKPCYALKMDIYRFFDSIDHTILKRRIRHSVHDEKVLTLVDVIIDSFEVKENVGIPLGNVTSQLFANIYLHALDDFVKKVLRIRYYLRFCDDFIFLSNDPHMLESMIPIIQGFLANHLRLRLHPKKVSIRKLSQGIDFVGYLFFAKYRLLRTRTKRRMKRRLQKAYGEYLGGKISPISMDQRLQSYLGILSHATQATLSQALKNAYWIRSEDKL